MFVARRWLVLRYVTSEGCAISLSAKRGLRAALVLIVEPFHFVRQGRFPYGRTKERFGRALIGDAPRK